jgi:eukaryotic-like serine/threonine-protein kinase
MADKPIAEKEVFNGARQIAAPEERQAYLQKACGHDPAAMHRVLELLRVYDQERSFLESSPVAYGATIDGPITERPGTVIGPYKLLEQIGEGGFGVVFMAEQQEPIRRKVALKVLKPGMDSQQVIARFEAERQALAIMDHPNIAKVLEAGQTSSGRPYFVMDLVKGLPITEYCDQSRLAPQERLELFVQVCQAVQHAHQKGIIHRDLKPSNVLVTLHDGTPLVKIIDFGIAKALGQPLTDKSLFTGFAQMIGTPLYMAPEQTALSNVDVDTRSDIYSLGVLLYELLTGTTPFDKERLRQASYDDICHIIREEEPPKPSTRMSTVGQAATTASEKRQSDPRQLSRLFRGELDWIVMKALEKDRNRRYESASAFAADVQRYLHDEPVQACPPSPAYRFRKLVRRNKALFAMVTVVAATLLVAGAAVTWKWRAAVDASSLAENRRIQAEQAEKKAQAINDFLVKELLAAGTPEVAQGRKMTVEEVLDRAAEKIDDAFPDQPEVEAAVRMAIGSAYKSLGLYAKALPHLERALAIRQEMLGEELPDTLDTLKEIGDTWIGQGKLVEGEQLHRRTLAMARRVLGEEDRRTLQLEFLISDVVRNQGRWDEAEALFRRCLDKQIRVLSEEHQDTLKTMNGLAAMLGERMGKWREAEPLARRCLEVQERVQGQNHPDTLSARATLADVFFSEGKWREAEALHRETLERTRSVFAPSHPMRLEAHHGQAFMLFWLDERLDEAETLFQQAVARWPSPEHPEALITRTLLGYTLLARGKLDDAEGEFGNILAVRERHPDLPDYHEPFAQAGLGLVLQERGKWGEAESALRQAVAGHRRALPGHFLTLRAASRLAVVLDVNGKHSEAATLFRDALEVWRKRFPPDHPERAFTLSDWAEHLMGEGNLREAEPALTEALDIERAKTPHHRRIGQTLCALGWLLTQTGRAKEGEQRLREGLKICQRAWGDHHWLPADAESRLGGCLTALGQFADAEKLLLGSYQTLQSARGTPPERAVEAADRIVKLYEIWGKPDKAAQWRASRPAQPKHADKGAGAVKDK